MSRPARIEIDLAGLHRCGFKPAAVRRAYQRLLLRDETESLHLEDSGVEQPVAGSHKYAPLAFVFVQPGRCSVSLRSGRPRKRKLPN